MARTVRDFLSHSSTTNVAAALDLGGGCAISVWENRDDRIVYDAPRGHAFSLYLEGGTGTRRLDAGAATGRPGTICIMPEGHSSAWEITTPFRFAHLYLPDAQLRALFAEIHDCDSRLLDLPDISFADMPLLAAPLSRCAKAAERGDLLLADAALAEFVAHLKPRPAAMRGGLPPYLLRRLDEWIDAHLDGPIRLADLALVSGLSEFHLHRMFRASRGVPLHSWITRKRIERAKAMLETSVRIVEIAVACGFSSQSHFTRTFRSWTNRTPAAYRKAVATFSSHQMLNAKI